MQPSHYNPSHCNWDYNPDIQKLFESATQFKKANPMKSSGADAFKTHLLLIDVQKDFCFPQGTLYVGGRSGTGAVDDSRRTAEFIYRNLDRITDITTTLDTHFAYQIFFPWFWVDINDNPLTAHTIIETGDIKSGKYKPNPSTASWLCNGNYAWLVNQVQHYCQELEKAGKYKLYLWPPHCLLGGEGHALVGVLHEARLFHSFLRGSQNWSEVKGGNPLTENYSIFRPEVLTRHDGNVLANKNKNFIETLWKSDAVIIGGQAASHCVKSSIEDFLDEILAQDPNLAKKVYILEDCMSSVVVPGGPDFTGEAEKALQKFSDAGMKLIKSTDDLSAVLK